MKIFFKDLFKALTLSFILAAAISLGFGAFIYDYVSEYDINKEQLRIDSENTVIYDTFGNIMSEFEKDGKEMVHYDEIPIEIIQAAIAIEDKDFFYHSGVDPKSIFRAFLTNIRTGEASQGGSTITQQLVKNIYLDPTKVLHRKIQEAIIATIVEQKLSKKEILSYYLNHNFYGYRAYGIKSALRVYFGQTIEEFKKDSPAERAAKAAFLVAIPNAPSYFDPYENPEPTMLRRNAVLTNMYVEGYINTETYNKAKDMDFLVMDEPGDFSEHEKIYYPEIVYYALEEAKDALDLSLEEVMYGGYQIYTSFDPDIYKHIRKNMSADSRYPKNPYASEDIQGAAVFVNPNNGEIYAMTGSKKETKEFLVLNRAFQSKRQPGSAFKPLIAYGPALESGKFSRYSSLSCKNTYGNYTVRDYYCPGYVTMQEAIRISRNAPAVWTLEQVGVDYAREYVKKLGIKLSENDIYLPIALGGLERGVTALEMADAYQVYANSGKKADAHIIRKVVNKNNEVVYEADEPKQIIDPENAKAMKEMLQYVVTSGTGTSAAIGGAGIAGKTGTNEMPGGVGNKDLWFVGFNDRLVGSIWMGYDNTTGNNFIPAGKTSSYPAAMFREIAIDILNELNQSRWPSIKEMDFKIYKTSNGNIKLKWEKTKGTKYEIYRNDDLVGTSVSNEFTDNYIETNETYTYKIIGYKIKDGKRVYESKEKEIAIDF